MNTIRTGITAIGVNLLRLAIALAIVLGVLPWLYGTILGRDQYVNYLNHMDEARKVLDKWPFASLPSGQSTVRLVFDLAENLPSSTDNLSERIKELITQAEPTLSVDPVAPSDLGYQPVSRASSLHDTYELLPIESRRKMMLRRANSLLGIGYQWGGVKREGMDCSGLVVLCARDFVPNLPRTSWLQHRYVRYAPIDKIEQSDLLFFAEPGAPTRRRISHVGIVVDPEKRTFIHASGKHGKVVISSLNDPFYKRRFISAGTLFM